MVCCHPEWEHQQKVISPPAYFQQERAGELRSEPNFGIETEDPTVYCMLQSTDRSKTYKEQVELEKYEFRIPACRQSQKVGHRQYQPSNVGEP